LHNGEIENGTSQNSWGHPPPPKPTMASSSEDEADQGDPTFVYAKRMQEAPCEDGPKTKKRKKKPGKQVTPAASSDDDPPVLKPAKSAPAKLAAPKIPKGVLLIAQTEELERDAELTKLIRAPRYL
jgi:hypothetical protein